MLLLWSVAFFFKIFFLIFNTISTLENHCTQTAVIAGWLQLTRAQNILFWFSVIRSMSKFFTTINCHNFFFHLKYNRLCIVIVVLLAQLGNIFFPLRVAPL